MRGPHQEIRHLIENYKTKFVSFQLRLGLAVYIVKFRPEQTKKLGCTVVV